MKFKSKKEFLGFCKTVAERTSDKWETIVFLDGSITTLTGSWTANKPVWCSFSRHCSAREVFLALSQSFENEYGVPQRPY